MSVLFRRKSSKMAAACAVGAVVCLLAIAGMTDARREGAVEHPPASESAGASDPKPALRSAETAGDCGGVFYPLEVTIEPEGSAAPGALATATLRVTASRVLGQVELELSPGAGVELLTEPTISVERIAPGEAYERQIVARLPQSLERRIVEITVSGWINGARLERSTIWNLLPGGPELSREVLRSDGTRLREVPARRIR
jgi:hypothetical protein